MSVAAHHVARALRQRNGETVQFLGDDDLAPQSRGPRQAEGEIEHVLLVLGWLLQQIEPLGVDDHMAGRAGERALAGAFEIDIVAMGDLQHGETDRGLDHAPRAIALDEDHLRHHRSVIDGADASPAAKSSASTAAPSAGAACASTPRTSAAASARGIRRSTVRPAPAAARSITAASTPSLAITAWVTGRASACSARAFSVASSAAGSAGSDQTAPSRPRNNSGLPPAEIATAPARSMPTAAPGPSLSIGPPSGSSIWNSFMSEVLAAREALRQCALTPQT